MRMPTVSERSHDRRPWRMLGPALSRLANRRGQALIELAIFGAIVITVLGFMLNYGLNADYNQYAMMKAQRRALAAAATLVKDSDPQADARMRNGAVSIIEDRHMPDPTTPMGTGSTTPVSASANVLKSYKLQETPNTPQAIPVTTYEFMLEGKVVKTVALKTSGFRYEFHDPASFGIVDQKGQWVNDPKKVGPIDRYEEIFGSNNVCTRKACLQSSGNLRVQIGSITILDPCEGQVVGYQGCKRMARQMTDTGYCTSECKRGRLLVPPDKNQPTCEQICGLPMTLPWYAQGKILESLFVQRRSLGLQPTEKKIVDISGSEIIKNETTSQIRTTDTIRQKETVPRTIIMLSGQPTQAKDGHTSLTEIIIDKQIKTEGKNGGAPTTTTSRTTPW